MVLFLCMQKCYRIYMQKISYARHKTSSVLIYSLWLFFYLDQWEHIYYNQNFTHQQHFSCSNVIFYNSVTTEREKLLSFLVIRKSDRQQPLEPKSIFRYTAVAESMTWPFQSICPWFSLSGLSLKLGEEDRSILNTCQEAGIILDMQRRYPDLRTIKLGWCLDYQIDWLDCMQ